MRPASCEKCANLTGLASFCVQMQARSSESGILHSASSSPPTRSSSWEPHDKVETGRTRSASSSYMRDH
jgi:hypothetical protein